MTLIFLTLPQSSFAAAKKQVAKPTPKLTYSCSVRKTVCAQMRSCDEAKFYNINCGLKKLDGNKDGIPCETICLR